MNDLFWPLAVVVFAAFICFLAQSSRMDALDRKLNTIAELQAQKIIVYTQRLEAIDYWRDRVDALHEGTFPAINQRINAVTEDLPELINGLIQAKLESVGQGKAKAPVTPKRTRSWSEILKDAEAAQTPEQAREERVAKVINEEV